MKATILILKEDKPRPTTYIVDVMAQHWRAAGYRVIEHFGIKNLPHADIAFLHVNQTIVPPSYTEAVSKYPKVINGAVLDISRRRYSMASVGPRERYEGPVIVKTDKNYGGVPETIRNGGLNYFIKRLHWSKFFNAMSRKTTSWSRISFLNPLDYPIFDSIHNVPPAVWKNKNLIVEKFIPERENNLFFVRFWTFFGRQNLTGRFGSRYPIVKFNRCVTEIMPVDIPQELVAWRATLNMDYGRFDFVMHDGRPVLLDVNKTQATGIMSEWSKKQFFTLSQGLNDFLKDF